MARHSHWHNIQVTKQKADKRRAGSFGKIAKAITLAAKEGGADVGFNFKLRMAVDAAKAVNMPKDNIERAIERGVGGSGEGSLETVVYEAMGPGGSSILVEAITDNRNRTNGNLRSLMTKQGLNPEAKVMWHFQRKGVVRVTDASAVKSWDDAEMALIEAGAEEIDHEEGIEVVSEITDLQKIAEAVKGIGLNPDEIAIEYLAKESLELSDEDAQRLAQMCEVVEADDDVNAIYTNVA